MSKELPILFSTDMVRAILDGQKCQTRRVIKPQHDSYAGDALDQPIIYPVSHNPTIIHGERPIKCPYGVSGDHLYVRESWCRGCEEADPYCHCDTEELRKKNHFYVYKADTPDARYPLDWDDGLYGKEGYPADADYVPRWRPSIHMPKEAARIWLEVVYVRVKRLQSINTTDIKKEGVRIPVTPDGRPVIPLTSDHFPHSSVDWNNPSKDDLFNAFWIELWDSINKKRGFGWDENPWVWVVEFKVLSTGGRP